MELIGKCKTDFEKWYFKNHCKSNMKFKELLPHHYEDVFGWFFGVDLSFQYGVYVDFFDSVGVRIFISYSEGYAIGSKEGFYYSIDYHCFDNSKSTRNETRILAIKKANELYNKQ